MKRVSADYHMKNDYVGWVCTNYAGVTSVEASQPHTLCFRGFGFGLLFIPAERPCVRGHPFIGQQDPSRHLHGKPSFSIPVVKLLNRLPASVNSFNHQVDFTWEDLFSEVPWFPFTA